MRFAYIIALTVFFLSGCASSTYRYGERTFSDRKEAEAAQRADLEAMRAALKPRSAPAAKSARIVIPSKAAVLERRLRPGGTAELRDYVATMSYNDYRFTAESVRYRNIFERLDIEESSDPVHATPKPGEAVIYFYLPDNKTVGWYYISGSTKRTPIHFDSGNPDRGARFKYFIDSIEALAVDEPK
jgi:hypothetical protein